MRTRPLPLLPLAPAIVVAVGIGTAVVIAVLGIMMLGRTSDEAAHLRAELVAATLAARLRGTPLEDRPEVLARAAKRSATEVVLVERDGRVLVSEGTRAPTPEEVRTLLASGQGLRATALGRTHFAARALVPPLEHLSVIAFVAAPSSPPGGIAIVRAVATLTALLLGIAVAVALAFLKATRDDVDFVRERIVHMARTDSDTIGQSIPIRSFDQVGVLTTAFNTLMTRFEAAEKSYRADLAQASEIDTERSAFLAGLSHELRTPLNAILGFAHVLETEVDGPLSAEARESLAIIRTSGEHLRTLIDDILDLSAMETGSLQLSLRAVDVRHLAEQVIREASATALDKPVSLTVTGERKVYAYADKRRVRQILTNLVNNAVKFTERGWVNVHIDTAEGFVQVMVRDTGSGIAKEEQRAIFEEYRQSGDLRARRAGTGLGLAITRRLVLMHGGTIDVESTPGQGSTFSFRLPQFVGEVMEIVDPLSFTGGVTETGRITESSLQGVDTWIRVEPTGPKGEPGLQGRGSPGNRGGRGAE